MSNDFNALVEQYKKKKRYANSGTVTVQNATGAKSMSDEEEEFWSLVDKYKQESAPTRTTDGIGVTRRSLLQEFEEKEDDIAPVREDAPWYKRGLFADGYQFGDVTKSILGIEDKKDSNESLIKTYSDPVPLETMEELEAKRDEGHIPIIGVTNPAEYKFYNELRNQKYLAQTSKTLSETKMDGTNRSILEEMEVIAGMESGKEKRQRKKAVIEKMEAMGIDSSDYALFVDDTNFTAENFAKWLWNSMGAGLNNFNMGATNTAEKYIGAPLKELGWENNPVSKLNDYYTALYENSKYKSDLSRQKLGGGGGMEFAEQFVEGTTAALPTMILAMMTGGASLEGTTAALTQQAAYQGAGILEKAGMTAAKMIKNPQFWLSYGRTYGNSYDKAKEEGADDITAAFGATISSLFNAGIEIGITGGSGIQGLPQELKEGGMNKILPWVKSSLEEGGEEGLQKFVDEIVGKVLYKSDDEILNPLEYGKEMLMGTMSGAALGGGQMIAHEAQTSISDSVQKRKASALTENEQKVFDKVVADEIAKAKENGEVSKKDEAKIREDVRTRLEKGDISTDTIEEVLGGDSFKSYQDTVKAEDDLVNQEKTLTEEYNKLNKMVNEKMTGEQQVRRDELRTLLPELRSKIEEQSKSSKRSDLKTKLSEEVKSFVQGSRLAESYNEIDRRRQAFQADLSQYDEKQRTVIQRAVESGILNNTNKTHNFVDLVAKLSAGKNVPFDFTNNAKLKESGFSMEGKTINGYVSGNSIAVNIQSAKALNTVVGHEITHVLEGTALYTELQNAVVQYAKTKGDYQSRYDTLSKLYESVEGANIDAELTADLVGDYLFTDSDFINNLSTNHRNVFQKIYDEVKYMLKVATAGSKEARELEKLKHTFEKALRESTTKNTADSGVKYSISEKFYEQLSSWDGKTIGFSFVVGETSQALQQAGIPKKQIRWDASKITKLLGKHDGMTIETVKQIPELLENPVVVIDSKKGDNSKIVMGDVYDENGKVVTAVLLLTPTSKKGNVLDFFKVSSAEGRSHIKSLFTNADGTAVPVRYVDKKRIQSWLNVNRLQLPLHNLDLDSTSSIDNMEGNVKGQFSISDSTGRQLSQEQAEYFKDSKVRDENGNLKVMYHGTPNGDFTVFKDGTYFTDNKEYADRYQNPGASSISTGKVTSNPKTFEVYLDIKKPFDLSDPEARRIYIEDYIKGGNAMGIDPYMPAREYAKIKTIDWMEGEDLRDFLIENGYDYDGLVLDEGADGGYGGEVQSRGNSYVVFSPEQVKRVDNAKPTSDPDIRKSISEDGAQQKAYGDYNVYGEDVALEAPAQEEVAPVAETQAEPAVNQTTVEDLFPDDTATVQEEYENLLAERDDIRGAMDIFAAVGDTVRAEQMMAEYEAVQARIAEIDADEADRLASIQDEDAPPEVDNRPEDVADNVPLTKKLVDDLTRSVRQQLGLSTKRSNEVRELIQRYSNEEFPSKAHLYTEIAERFGTYTESSVDEDLKGVKALLRTYGISVDQSIKDEIADYGQLMRRNFGKVKFSNNGLPVDVAYKEFQEALPGYFPEDVYSPTDQLMRILEVANMDTTMEAEYEIDTQTLEEVTDTIMNGVGEFKQNWNETLANRLGKESFDSLMKTGDRYVPPLRLDLAPVRVKQTRPAIESVQADPDDIAPVYDTSSGQQSILPETETPKPETEAPKKLTRKDLHLDIMDGFKTYFRNKGFDFDEVLKNAKNRSTFTTVDNTPQRVMEKTLGYKEGQILSDLTVNMVAQNETEGIKWLNSFTDKKTGLLAKISKQYGIKPGSKASAAAQMYAEGFYVGENDAIIAYGDKELAADFPNVKMQENIKKLARDPRIRQIYDETLQAINKSRTRNAYPEIPRLDNYFLHFRAMEDTFSRLGLPFNPNDIRAKDLPTDLNGVTADLKPGQPYFASAMHRTGKRTSFDLLGGLEKYLTSAKNQIYHIDDIQKLRALRNYVAETYGQANGLQDLDLLSDEEAEQRIEQVYNSHLSTFAKFLNEEANVLAGKTSLIDRGLEGVIGRRGMTFIDTLNRQVGANMVGYNVSSSLTNFLAPVQAFAKTNKFDFVKAMAQTSWNKIASVFGRGDGFAEQSPVMIRRKGADRFYRTPYQKVADVGYVLMGVVDNISTELIARTKYNEFTRKGMSSSKAHYETDKWVSRLMGDRSLGQMPQVYNSKTLGLITKFQLEVRNQLDSQFYDTIQETKASTEDIQNGLVRNAKRAAKITSTFVQLAVMQHLFGKAFESVAGYNPAFDIIDTLIKTFGWDDDEEDEDTVLDNIEEGFQALLGDLPYTSVMTGGRIPISSALPVTELIKGVDQYGNDKNRWDTIKEAAPYYLLPGGYGQVKKTVAGLEMFDEDLPIAGSYTDSGNLRFPVEDNLQNRVKAALFGQWASENARDYFNNERKPLAEKQIQEFIDSGLPIQDYWEYREGLAEHEKLGDKADYIDSLDLPISTKNLLVNNVAGRKESIDMTDYGEYGSLEEMDFATQYPEKYEVAMKVGGYAAYVGYQEGMKDMKLAEKADYISRLNLTTAQKNILINSETDRKEPIDLTGYENYSSFEEFEFAKKNPEAYAMAKAVGGYEAYTEYSDALNDIKADKDKFGKSISGTRKTKVAEYISSLDIPMVEKYILFKSEYPSTDDYNYEIIDYVNSMSDMTFEEKIEVLRSLDFDVDAEGNIYW